MTSINDIRINQKERMNNKTATVIGATGLIGGHIVRLLEQDDSYNKIRVVARRPVAFSNPKVEAVLIDFSDEEAFRSAVAGNDAVLCAVGTTRRKVKGDRAAYRKVDHDIPVNAARFCEETGCQRFILVSSVGADSTSSNYYIRFKGEVEDAVKKMNIPSVYVLRPSMLLGKRDEFRFGELIGKALSAPLSFMFPSDYRPVNAGDVAAAMVAASKKGSPGFHLCHYKDIIELKESL
jgi:uncharacterized protein YbjT (DUF2867 family)